MRGQSRNYEWHYQPTAMIHPSATFGDGTMIWDHAYIRADVKMGEHCAVGSNVYIGIGAKFGDRVRIQNGAHLCAFMEVGNDVFIGQGVLTSVDRHPRVNNPHYKREAPKIGNNVSIGAGANILPGVTVGDGAIVGAGAVVVRDVAPYTTVVGNPARPVIRRRKPQEGTTIGAEVRYKYHDPHIAVITLDRPPLNTYTNATLRELETAWALAEQDGAVRVIILTGAGDHFCAGHDLKAAQSEALASEPPAIHYGDLEITKPVIAAVKGYALGGGASMALACDLMVMSSSAKLGYPQAKHGIISIGGPQRLPRILPGLARWLLFSGETIDAWRLMSLGICVDRATDGSLMDVAMKYAERIAQASPDSVRVLKRSIEAGSRYPLDDAFRESKRIAAEYEATDVYRDNLKAFVEKRTPGWKR